MGDLGLFKKVGKSKNTPSTGGGVQIRFLQTESGDAVHEILEASLLTKRGVRKRIYIENPYLASDEILIAASVAAKRGEAVRVMMPAEGDSAIMDAGHLETARVVIEAGAKVYSFPEMTYPKLMACDENGRQVARQISTR